MHTEERAAPLAGGVAHPAYLDEDDVTEPQPRSDAPMIRHLAHTHGVDVAREWQGPPLLTLPEMAVEDLLRHADDSGTSIDLEHLPWEDVVLDVGTARRLLPIVTDDEERIVRRHAVGLADPYARRAAAAVLAMLEAPEVAHRGRAWIRVRMLTSALETSIPRTSPWLRELEGELRRQGDPEGLLLVECWDDAVVRVSDRGLTTEQMLTEAKRAAGGDSFPLWPDVILVDRYTLQQRHLYTGPCRERAHGIAWCHLSRCLHDAPDVQCLSGVGVLSQAARLAVGVMSVFVDPPVYVVERRAGPGRLVDRRAMKTARLKPWLRTDLTSLILVDPSRVDDYGHPSTRGSGERASPRLHPRRGHWRTLRRGEEDERKTWVRPAWIGADAWDHQGTHYQLAQMPAAVAIRRARGQTA